LYRAPRGTADILPSEQGYWSYTRQKVHELCELYGYQRIDTPAFEDAGLFVRSIGEGTDIVEKEMYSMEDRSGGKLTLRPEGTASVCRAYVEHGMHSLPQPVRLYYDTAIFRYERPQAGRYRQHQQFGFEAIGESDPALDAEIVDMAWQLYVSLGLKGLVLNLNTVSVAATAARRILKDFGSIIPSIGMCFVPIAGGVLVEIRCAFWTARNHPVPHSQRKRPAAPITFAKNVRGILTY